MATRAKIEKLATSASTLSSGVEPSVALDGSVGHQPSTSHVRVLRLHTPVR